MRVVFAKFSLLTKIQTVGQTNFYSPPLLLACPKTYMHGLSTDFEHFFLIKKQFCVFLRNMASKQEML